MHLQKIKLEVEKIFGVDISDKCQEYKYLIARQTFYYIALKTTLNSKNKIGKFINKDHATVINAERKLEANLRFDEQFRLLFKKALLKFKVQNDYEHLFKETVMPEYLDLSDKHREIIEMITKVPQEHLDTVKTRLKPMIAMLA